MARAAVDEREDRWSQTATIMGPADPDRFRYSNADDERYYGDDLPADDKWPARSVIELTPGGKPKRQRDPATGKMVDKPPKLLKVPSFSLIAGSWQGVYRKNVRNSSGEKVLVDLDGLRHANFTIDNAVSLSQMPEADRRIAIAGAAKTLLQADADRGTGVHLLCDWIARDQPIDWDAIRGTKYAAAEAYYPAVLDFFETMQPTILATEFVGFNWDPIGDEPEEGEKDRRIPGYACTVDVVFELGGVDTKITLRNDWKSRNADVAHTAREKEAVQTSAAGRIWYRIGESEDGQRAVRLDPIPTDRGSITTFKPDGTWRIHLIDPVDADAGWLDMRHAYHVLKVGKARARRSILGAADPAKLREGIIELLPDEERPGEEEPTFVDGDGFITTTEARDRTEELMRQAAEGPDGDVFDFEGRPLTVPSPELAELTDAMSAVVVAGDAVGSAVAALEVSTSIAEPEPEVEPEPEPEVEQLEEPAAVEPEPQVPDPEPEERPAGPSPVDAWDYVRGLAIACRERNMPVTMARIKSHWPKGVAALPDVAAGRAEVPTVEQSCQVLTEVFDHLAGELEFPFESTYNGQPDPRSVAAPLVPRFAGSLNREMVPREGEPMAANLIRKIMDRHNELAKWQKAVIKGWYDQAAEAGRDVRPGEGRRTERRMKLVMAMVLAVRAMSTTSNTGVLLNTSTEQTRPAQRIPLGGTEFRYVDPKSGIELVLADTEVFVESGAVNDDAVRLVLSTVLGPKMISNKTTGHAWALAGIPDLDRVTLLINGLIDPSIDLELVIADDSSFAFAGADLAEILAA